MKKCFVISSIGHNPDDKPEIHSVVLSDKQEDIFTVVSQLNLEQQQKVTLFKQQFELVIQSLITILNSKENEIRSLFTPNFGLWLKRIISLIQHEFNSVVSNKLNGEFFRGESCKDGISIVYEQSDDSQNGNPIPFQLSDDQYGVDVLRIMEFAFSQSNLKKCISWRTFYKDQEMIFVQLLWLTRFKNYIFKETELISL